MSVWDVGDKNLKNYILMSSYGQALLPQMDYKLMKGLLFSLVTSHVLIRSAP